MRTAVSALVAAMVLGLAAPAGAATTADPPDPGVPFDIAEASVRFIDLGTFLFELDPNGDWHDDAVDELRWSLDLDDDGSADAHLVVTPHGGGATATLRGPSDEVVTTLPVFVDADAPRSVFVRLDLDAIGDPETATVTAESWGDTDGDGVRDTGETDETGAIDVLFHEPVLRVAGENRVGTAVAISEAAFDDGTAEAVVLARADDYPDALAGAPLAVAGNGPLLITSRDHLDAAVADEIRRVLPAGGPIALLGGPAALGTAIEDEVRAMGYEPTRFGGSNRFQTALSICNDGLGAPDAVVATTGLNFPDALAAGPAASAIGGCVLLTQGERSEAGLDAYLEDHPDAEVYAVGGPAVRALGDRAEPIAGDTRYNTAAAVASAFEPEIPTVAVVASGETFADALAGGALAGLLGEGLILASHPWGLEGDGGTYIDARKKRFEIGLVLGGTAAVTPETLHQLERAITEDR